jgi:hypothetical protein
MMIQTSSKKAKAQMSIISGFIIAVCSCTLQLQNVHAAFTPNNIININSNSNINSNMNTKTVGNINRGGAFSTNVPLPLASPLASPLAPLLVLSASNNSNNSNTKSKQLSRPERKALEREKKKQSKNKKNTKNNNRQFNLHSTKVSTLTKASSNAEDVITAIKRAQKRHDVHDIRNIEQFLVEEVDASFAYGFRGSLLARLAVAALHMSEHQSARMAIEVRKNEHRDSMMPMESAAIIRGLLRVHNVTDAMELLDDELSLPSKVRTLYCINCIL